MFFDILKPVIDKAVFRSLKDIYSQLIDEMPELVTKGHELLALPADKRISLGLSLKEGKPVFSLLLLKEDSWALRKAEEFENKFEGYVIKKVTGISHSSWPEEKKRQKKSRTNLKPGVSIGSIRAYAGTMGCFIKIERDSGDWYGVTSAAHVLALSKNTEQGDPILVPGYPDGPRVRKNQIGILHDYTLLVHHLDDDEESPIPLNSDDVAIVKLSPQPSSTPKNLVPNPKDPKEMSKISGILNANELFNYVGESVYKTGRTSGFTKGIIDTTNIVQYPITLPNRKNYLFTNVLAIEHEGSKAFSQPGDSGALVYNEDMKAIGFVIGGSNDFSIVIPCSECLLDHEAKLVV